MKCAVLSDLGLVRSRNEDNYLVDERRGLLVVCDGMGGCKGGDVASATAIEIISKYLPPTNAELNLELLNESILEANRSIYDQSTGNVDLQGMGTTVTAVVLKDRKLLVAHIGDSVLFIISNNNIKKITQDHTLAEQMILENVLTAGEAATSPYNHVLTRALGIEKQVYIDNYEEYLHKGDILLLCSDGLTHLLGQDDILTIVRKERSLDKAVEALVQLALDRGGIDNVTVIVASI